MSRQVETLAAEKALEEEMSTIADIKRSRVAVEKTVAEQEEQIATLRVVEQANRDRDAVVIAAEAEAQGALVKDIKEAEAAETAAGHLAKRQLTLAQADMEASELNAQSKIRLAEGVKAEEAASGLASVDVERARAIVVRELGEAEADKLRVAGLAEAEIAEAKLKGEAAGLTEKAAAMRELEGVGQEHEEFVRTLEADTKVRLASVDAQVGIASAQADAMKAGLESADIDIVGGSDIFVDRVIGAIGSGKALDAFVERSEVANTALDPYLEGDEDLVSKLAEAIGGLGPDGLRDLSVADLLRRIGK